SKTDTGTADKILKETKAKVLNLTGKTSLIETMAILKMSHLYIGNDSGPLFIAAAVGTPTLAIFGPTDASVINPPGRLNVAAQSPADCSPCYNPLEGLEGRAYKCNSYKCMAEISMEKVFQAASELLTQSKQRPGS
ncbi:MAG TPA: glycosyltransferase family 9 protein, partial [Candidatus Brocadiales bacterium]|nr:glycosyltransferase family 9 protein [Candidatus Brocadiales bacterium]